VLCVIGAVALVLVPFIAKFFLTTEQVRQWLRARAGSEGLKSLIYRFQARAAPFANADRAAVLLDAAKHSDDWLDKLAEELAGEANDREPAPGVLEPEAYVRVRVEDQVEYYRKHARANAARARRFRRLELIAAAAAAILGAGATALKLAPKAELGGLGAWVAVITTIGGAVAAHAAASRYDQQARVFFATARRLEDLRNDWRARGQPQDGARWSEFVTACEDAISSENRGWMAKLDPEEQRAA
jgi:hypothetical protein